MFDPDDLVFGDDTWIPGMYRVIGTYIPRKNSMFSCGEYKSLRKAKRAARRQKCGDERVRVRVFDDQQELRYEV